MPFIKSPDLNESLSGSDLFIYSDSGEELLVLNQSGLFIWSLCEDYDEAGILEQMACLYPDADPGALQTDIRACLSHFEAKGLLRKAG